MKLNNEKVLDFLPHRPPFLFIDHVDEIKEGDNTKKGVGCKVVAHFSVKEDLDILRGHFPGNPILPGVVQVEMMAQAACFTVFSFSDSIRKDDFQVALVSANESKFRKPVTPGMDLKIHTNCIKVRGPMYSFECEVTHDGQVVSQANILASIRGI